MAGVTHILLIDDDAVDRAAVRRALARSGLAHELHEAADGETGLRLAEGRAFDCVLLDYRLPDVDTFDLLPQLLGREGGAQAVLMLTGEADPDIALRLMRAGALDYLAKAEVDTRRASARAIRLRAARGARSWRTWRTARARGGGEVASRLDAAEPAAASRCCSRSSRTTCAIRSRRCSDALGDR